MLSVVGCVEIASLSQHVRNSILWCKMYGNVYDFVMRDLHIYRGGGSRNSSKQILSTYFVLTRGVNMLVSHSSRSPKDNGYYPRLNSSKEILNTNTTTSVTQCEVHFV